MIINFKIFIIKLFNRNKINADRKIVKFLSKQILLKRKRNLSDYLFQMMDDFKNTKSESEYIFLLNIMQEVVNLDTKRIIMSFKRMDKETQKLLKMYAPEDFRSLLP
jgi:hypothetical protein